MTLKDLFCLQNLRSYQGAVKLSFLHTKMFKQPSCYLSLNVQAAQLLFVLTTGCLLTALLRSDDENITYLIANSGMSFFMFDIP